MMRSSPVSVLSIIVVGSTLGLGLGACGTGAGEASEIGDASAGTDSEAPIPAGGISIVEVELNQGTRIPIGVGGDWVDAGARSGVAIASRDAVIRVHYSVDAGWIPREIEARLSLIHADGTTEVIVDAGVVAGSSARGDLDGPFSFRLAADDGQTLAGTRYQIELWDREPGLGAGFERGAWINPADLDQPIGFESVPLQIKIVMVPIEYGDTPLSLDEDLQRSIVDNLYEQNPTTEVLWSVHPSVAYAGQLNSLSSLLPVLAQLRADEQADPNVYYHALVDVGSQSLGGVSGISYAANDTKDDAGSRVSATVVWSADPALAVETFTHETGHAQGLAHVECPSFAADAPDPSFPHADGRIGDWGVAVLRMQVYDPAEVYDYMSYCGPTWVSDWTWNKTYARIETLSAWDFEGGSGREADPGQRLLVGAARVDAGADPADASWVWWTMPGGVDARRSAGVERFEFETEDGERIVASADVATLSDRRTRWVKVVLPADLGELSAITYLAGEGARAIEIEPASLTRAPPREHDEQPRWRPSF